MRPDPLELALSERRRRATEWQAIYEVEQIIDDAPVILDLDCVELSLAVTRLEEHVTAFESRLTAIEQYIVDMEAHRRDMIGRGDRYEPELRAAISEAYPDEG